MSVSGSAVCWGYLTIYCLYTYNYICIYIFLLSFFCSCTLSEVDSGHDHLDVHVPNRTPTTPTGGQFTLVFIHVHTSEWRKIREKNFKLRSLHVVICCLRYIIALVRCFAHQLAALGQTKDSGNELGCRSETEIIADASSLCPATLILFYCPAERGKSQRTTLGINLAAPRIGSSCWRSSNIILKRIMTIKRATHQSNASLYIVFFHQAADYKGRHLNLTFGVSDH